MIAVVLFLAARNHCMLCAVAHFNSLKSYYEALRKLDITPVTKFIDLTEAEARVLVKKHAGEELQESDIKLLQKLSSVLAAAIAHVNSKAFVCLGSKSPRDALTNPLLEPKVAKLLKKEVLRCCWRGHHSLRVIDGGECV